MVAKSGSATILTTGQTMAMLSLVSIILAAFFHLPAGQEEPPYPIGITGIFASTDDTSDAHPASDQDICHGCAVTAAADWATDGRTALWVVPILLISRLPSRVLEPLDPPPR